MEGMEEKLGSILGNPAMMQKIFAMAQSLGAAENGSPSPPPPSPPPPENKGPNIDLGAMQKMISLAGSTNIDKNQKALLSALSPYLSRDRIRKLEQAMRAAKMAGFAATALAQQPSGR